MVDINDHKHKGILYLAITVDSRSLTVHVMRTWIENTASGKNAITFLFSSRKEANTDEVFLTTSSSPPPLLWWVDATYCD